MRFSKDLLEAPPEVFGKELALSALYGVTSRFVRGPRGHNGDLTIEAVEGQAERARRSGATEEEIRDAVCRGVIDPPRANPERVEEIKRRYPT
jgi:hypothetical protein